MVGIQNSYLPEWLETLRQAFNIQSINTVGLPRSVSATWPMGEK